MRYTHPWPVCLLVKLMQLAPACLQKERAYESGEGWKGRESTVINNMIDCSCLHGRCRGHSRRLTVRREDRSVSSLSEGEHSRVQWSPFWFSLSRGRGEIRCLPYTWSIPEVCMYLKATDKVVLVFCLHVNVIIFYFHFFIFLLFFLYSRD